MILPEMYMNSVHFLLIPHYRVKSMSVNLNVHSSVMLENRTHFRKQFVKFGSRFLGHCIFVFFPSPARVRAEETDTPSTKPGRPKFTSRLRCIENSLYNYSI
jgi:hypothetical protein